jgi:hypothetical protein
MSWHRPGVTVSVNQLVKLSAGGAIDLVTLGSVSEQGLVVDVSGWFTPESGPVRGGRLETVDQRRVFDSRTGGAERLKAGSTTRIETGSAGVPSGAAAVVVTLTAAEAAGPGFLNAWASGPLPVTSVANVDAAEQTRASGLIVPLAPDGSFQVFTQSATHLVVDVAGFFTSATAALSTDGLFVPVDPVRVVDTRGTFRWVGSRTDLVALTAAGVPVDARAAALTVAAVNTKPGWVSLWAPDRVWPGTSTVNTSNAETTVAASTIVPTASAVVAGRPQHSADVVVDVNGWFTGSTVVAPKDVPEPNIFMKQPSDAVCLTVPSPTAADLNATMAGVYGPLGVWLGSDYIGSVEIGPAQRLHIFGDTWVGPNDGRRSTGPISMQHSTFIAQNGPCFWPLLAASGSLLTPGNGNVYWVSGAAWNAGVLELNAFEMFLGPGGFWDFHYVNTVAIAVPGLDFSRAVVRPGPRAVSGTVTWGSVTQGDGYLYIEGWNQRMNQAPMYLARVPSGVSLAALDQWEYSAGSLWTRDPDAAVPVFAPQPCESSVLNSGLTAVGWVGAVHCVEELGRSSMRVYKAPGPQGPWRLVREFPDNADRFTYNHSLDIDFYGPGSTVALGYWSQAGLFEDLHSNLAKARPVWVEIDLLSL